MADKIYTGFNYQQLILWYPVLIYLCIHIYDYNDAVRPSQLSVHISSRQSEIICLHGENNQPAYRDPGSQSGISATELARLQPVYSPFAARLPCKHFAHFVYKNLLSKISDGEPARVSGTM